jgi:hypothetical protein
LREQGKGAWANYNPRLRAALGRGEQAPAGTLAVPGAQGPAGQLAGAAPVRGGVDVTVTHKNPPPGTTIAATGTGDVNLAQPRVEYAQLGVA